MTKRDKILGSVVVLLFGSAGYVLYNGIFSSASKVVISGAPDIESNKTTIVDLLPHGDKLDFSKLKERSQRVNITVTSIYTYPSLNPGEVGVPVTELLKEKQPENLNGF